MPRSLDELMRVCVGSFIRKKRTKIPYEELYQVGYVHALKKHNLWSWEGKTDDDYEKYIVFTSIKRMMTYSISQSRVYIGPKSLPKGEKAYYAESQGERDVLLHDPQRDKMMFEFKDLVDFLCRGLDEREQLIFVTFCLEPKKRFMKICQEIEVPYPAAVYLLEHKVLPIVRARWIVAFSALDKTQVSQDPEFLLGEREEIYRSDCREAVRKIGNRKAEVRKRVLALIGSGLVGRSVSADAGSSEEDLLEGSEKSGSEGSDSSDSGV